MYNTVPALKGLRLSFIRFVNGAASASVVLAHSCCQKGTRVPRAEVVVELSSAISRWVKCNPAAFKKPFESTSVGTVHAGVDNGIKTRVEILQPFDHVKERERWTKGVAEGMAEYDGKKRQPAYQESSNYDCDGFGCLHLIRMVLPNAFHLCANNEENNQVHDYNDK